MYGKLMNKQNSDAFFFWGGGGGGGNFLQNTASQEM